MSGIGLIYYIACTETMRCKIGYTSGNPLKRLRALQTGSPTRLVLMACHPGTMEDEREIHQTFAEHGVHGEWFEASDQLIEHVSFVVWLAGTRCAEGGIPAPDWLRVALKSMDEERALPPHLAALISAVH